jgi:hypothetical protein
MNKSVWVKESETMLDQLGFRASAVSVARKINGVFTMASSYSIPEKDLADVLLLLSESKVVHEAE